MFNFLDKVTNYNNLSELSASRRLNNASLTPGTTTCRLDNMEKLKKSLKKNFIEMDKYCSKEEQEQTIEPTQKCQKFILKMTEYDVGMSKEIETACMSKLTGLCVLKGFIPMSDNLSLREFSKGIKKCVTSDTQSDSSGSSSSRSGSRSSSSGSSGSSSSSGSSGSSSSTINNTTYIFLFICVCILFFYMYKNSSNMAQSGNIMSYY